MHSSNKKWCLNLGEICHQRREKAERGAWKKSKEPGIKNSLLLLSEVWNDRSLSANGGRVDAPMLRRQRPFSI